MNDQNDQNDRRGRDNWGRLFRQAVSNGRSWAILLTALIAVPLMVFTAGISKVVGAIGSLFALASAHPKSPLIPALVEWLPKLPTKGGGG